MDGHGLKDESLFRGLGLFMGDMLLLVGDDGRRRRIGGDVRRRLGGYGRIIEPILVLPVFSGFAPFGFRL